MKRPKLEDFHYDFKYHGALEEYCTLLEETIAALKDEYAETMQNYTDCVNYNESLEQRIVDLSVYLADSAEITTPQSQKEAFYAFHTELKCED